MSLPGSPERAFALFSLLAGAILIALLPPGSGNERFNYQRTVTVASGHVLVEAAFVPAGVVDFIEAIQTRFPDGSRPPFSYSKADWVAVASIELGRGTSAKLEPNPIAVLNPLSYFPQVAAVAVSRSFGLSPLALFYVARLAGLLTGVALTFLAIRTMPFHRSSLAAIALLPSLQYSRSILDADQFTNGLAFFFIAYVTREIVREGPIAKRSLTVIVATALILAQTKSAYLMLPLFALAIPAKRFASGRHRSAIMALVILPGAACSLAWMLVLRETYFADIRYATWSGVVDPEAQMGRIVADPLSYVSTVLNTLFTTPLIPLSVLQMLGPAFPMPLWFYAALAVALFATFITEPEVPALSRVAKTNAIFITLATIGMILTLLYLQWTRLGSEVIEGFQGRYLFPLVPLILVLIPSGDKGKLLLQPIGWVCCVGVIGIGATFWTLWTVYYV